MKAVNSFRSRMRLADASIDAATVASTTTNANACCENNNDAAAAAAPVAQRRRACTSGNSTDAVAFLSPPLTGVSGDNSARRAWGVVPRKLRGLHPSPGLIYVRENPALVTQAMDKLYATLVSTYSIDSRDIRVTDVPTAFDLPAVVRRIGKDKHVVVIVGLLTRDSVWFDAGQIDRVRSYLLQWSQENCVPLVDGLLIGDSHKELAGRIASPQWNVAAQDNIASVAPLQLASSRADADEGDIGGGEYMFGHYLAHRAMEMFYFEHRGW
ncbi:hypothetical protein BX661DRAFT_182846 [Kickxella alabastrina]|uniref:uncharacterized protein n=1 Tax=Kickxella alabastrina TaxID=61397 RepID=UPI00221E42B0|nr:uncharacterized protein BX661DRAFT_182846 [Kickxella alabastrina]KAI7827198.1 hypothetical protein BX661DRAFT_182846 [Kickxella alabastrina]